MYHHYNTETSKRLKMMNPSQSQGTFRDSARQALQAQKLQDGSLRISTPFHELQSKKVANLAHKLNQLNSVSSSVRCPSHLMESSVASVTAATSYAPRGSRTNQQTRQGHQYRPNSNISNMLESSNQPFVTDLTRFSQNSTKDLSPLRASALAGPNHLRKASHGRLVDPKKFGAHSAIQDSRKNISLGQGEVYSPSDSRNPANRNYEGLQRARNSGSRERQLNGNICRSASFQRGGSVQSMRTNQSSPERLVNIVCPPSREAKQRKNGQRVIAKATRPRSDMRHPIYTSFHKNDEDKKKGFFKHMQAVGGSFGISASSHSNFLSGKRLQNSKKMVTPTKSRKSLHSQSASRSKSKSHSRLGVYRNSQHDRSTPGLSANKSHSKVNRRAQVPPMSKAEQRKHQDRRRSISRHSVRSKSAHSASLSNNSNLQEPSEGMKTREQRRASKYIKHQKQNSSIKKNFNFASIEAQCELEQNLQAPKLVARAASGQVTGKFRSLNEPVMNQIMAAAKVHQHRKKAQQVGFVDYKQSLKTEDDYCETLTASSEDSPMRPSTRVQRAAALTTKEYLADVNQRLENANHHVASIREFGPRKMKAAYQGINERQEARLQCLKQQMQDSLVETHQLQAKLQSSACDEREMRKGAVSQFNSLVLEFSQNLEDKAAELIEATESKRKNLAMKGMIAELQATRKQRSASKSMPTSARGRRSSLSHSKKRSSAKKLRSTRSMSSRKGSLSSRSGRSKSKGNKKRGSRSKSAKKLSKRSKSKTKSVRRQKSARSQRSGSKSARSGKSGRSVTSGAASRGRSRSKKKMRSVKRNIFEQTNGFRDVGQSSSLAQKSARSKSRKSIKTKSSRGRSLSSKSVSRAQELARKCQRLVTNKYSAFVEPIQKKMAARLTKKRSVSKKKRMLSKPSKSRSKSKKRVLRKKTKSRSKSATRQRKGSKSPSRRGGDCTPKVTPKVTPQITPCMTPLHNILRNSMGDHDNMSDFAPRGHLARFGSTAQAKRVQIQSRRLRDITHLSSSDSDSSYDSEDSLDNVSYLKRQQAHLSPWQRACIRKQLPKKFR